MSVPMVFDMWRIKEVSGVEMQPRENLLRVNNGKIRHSGVGQILGFQGFEPGYRREDRSNCYHNLLPLTYQGWWFLPLPVLF